MAVKTLFRSGRKIFLVAHDRKHGAATDKSESGAGRPWPTAALEEGIETFRGVQPNRADTTRYSTADNPSISSGCRARSYVRTSVALLFGGGPASRAIFC